MPCQLICPNLRCRKILSVPEEVRGKLVKCQFCQTMFRVPDMKRQPGGGGAANRGAHGDADEQNQPMKKSA
jgi:hypothetical protein